VIGPRPFSEEPQALFCDEYALTMAQSFWRHGSNERTCFELVVRHLPEHRGYLVVAGLEQALAFLAGFRFRPDDLAYLRDRGIFQDGFLRYLETLRFQGDVNAIREGTVIGAETPLLQVVASRIEATLVEAALLATINHQTSIASKAARIVEAAGGRPVWDFSLRRVHGPPAGLGVARASYIAGAAGTATEIAGERLGIPTTGTMAHHYVLGFGPGGEQRAFEQFLGDYPERAVLLVDTYDTLRGVEHAIAASRATQVALAGVRLDSGDVAALSVQSRRVLDAAGMETTGIVASGDLDEYRIQRLLRAGARIDSFGVGTALGTSNDAPALGGVYKLVAQEEDGELRPVMKHSEQKANDPGMHQVFRVGDSDHLALAMERHEGRALLERVMTGGHAEPYPTLEECREHCDSERAALPERVRRLEAPEAWPLLRTPALLELRRSLGEARVDARRH
jgi:nicotinate phosphoribosyltransferase